MLTDAEAEPSSPRDTDEMRTFDPKCVEDREDVRDAQQHRVGAHLIRLVAATVTSVVDEDEAELARQALQG